MAGDVTLDRLSRSEQVLVFAWRMLVAGRPHCGFLHAELEAYAGDEARNVLAGLSAVLMALGQGSRKTISVGHPGCALVTQDERNVLALLATAQQCDEDLLAVRLCWTVRPESQRAALVILQTFAVLLDQIGLRLPALGGGRPDISARCLALC
ncbi:MAG TPA: hypothetical protein VGC36_07715 [Rhizomicrobium sp.]